jgi:hypothetical protein
MSERVAAIAAALLVAACAAPPSSPDAFSFAVMGDAPYNRGEERAFTRMMQRVDAEDDLAFVVHVGDIKGGGPCSDELFARRHAQFDASRHPFVYTPGDNEWVECAQALERLSHIRRTFFAGSESLGQGRIATEAQDQCLAPPFEACGCGALPENRAWRRGPVDFVTLHIVGENDGLGVSAERDAEVQCRREGNRRWLERAVRSAQERDARILVVMIQADPWLTLGHTFDAFLEQLARSARELARPVLFVHGDTHVFKVDYPFPNVTRLETYGSPFVGWVKVTVSPGEAAPFRFDGRLVAVVPDER